MRPFIEVDSGMIFIVAALSMTLGMIRNLNNLCSRIVSAVTIIVTVR